MNIKYNFMLEEEHLETIFGYRPTPADLIYVIEKSFVSFKNEYIRKFNELPNQDRAALNAYTNFATKKFNAGINSNPTRIFDKELNDSRLYDLFTRTQVPQYTKEMLPYMNNTAFDRIESLVLGLVDNKYAVVYFESNIREPLIETYKLESLTHERGISLAFNKMNLDQFISKIQLNRSKANAKLFASKSKDIQDVSQFINAISNLDLDNQANTLETLMHNIIRNN